MSEPEATPYEMPEPPSPMPAPPTEGPPPTGLLRGAQQKLVTEQLTPSVAPPPPTG